MVSGEYTTCSSLLTSSSALSQVVNVGILLSKLVIWKPGMPADASGGFIDLSTLAVRPRSKKGWSSSKCDFHVGTGVPVWEVCVYSDNNRAFRS